MRGAGCRVRDEQAMLETLGLLVPVVLIVMYALMARFTCAKGNGTRLASLNRRSEVFI